MADNVTLNSGTGGAVLAADDIAGVHHQRVKISQGADGSATDVSSAAPLQVTLANTGANATAVKVDGSAATQPVSDGGGSLTVDGSVTATLGSGDNVAGRVKITDGTDVADVLDLANSNPIAVAIVDASGDQISSFGGGTQYTEDAAAAANPVGTVPMLIRADTPATQVTTDGDNVAQRGTNYGAAYVTILDGSGAIIAGATQYTEDAAAAGDPVGNALILVRKDTLAALTSTDGDNVAARGTDKGELYVKHADAIVLGAGSAAIGKLAANSGVDIGDVDVTSLPNVTLAAGTNTNEVVGDIAHDTGVSGNPVQIAGAAQDTDDTAPPNRVSAESDVTRFATDRDGSQFVRPHGPQVWSYHVDGSSALTDATVHAAPGAGLSLYVTDIMISLGAATALNVFFEEGASKVLGPWYLEAVNGRSLKIHFQTPKKITANTALTVTSSAAVAHTIDVTGFTAQG